MTLKKRKHIKNRQESWWFSLLSPKFRIRRWYHQHTAFIILLPLFIKKKGRIFPSKQDSNSAFNLNYNQIVSYP